MNSFDIQDSDTESTLILICKTYLKMNQAIDMGDMDGYQKLSRVYDTLRKSAKFTAAQKKEQQENFVDCVGSLVAYCEKEGGRIPKFEITVDQDIVDTVINDLKDYTSSLIKEDPSLSQQIEDYIKKKEATEMIKKDKEAKKAQKVIEVKEIKLSQTIDVGDVNVRAKQTREFIADGNRVKVSLRMKGRQMEHPEISVQVLENFYEKVKDVATMDKKPTAENRSVFMMLSPTVKK